MRAPWAWLAVWAVSAALAILTAGPTLAPLGGRVLIDGPLDGTTFTPGESVSVHGAVIQDDGTPIGGINVTMVLINPEGRPLLGTNVTVATSLSGTYFLSLALGGGYPDGTYRIRVSTTNASITEAEVSIQIRTPGPTPLPALWLAVAGVVTALAVLGVWLASRRFRLPLRFAACASCGRAVPEGAPKCPQCGADAPPRAHGFWRR